MGYLEEREKESLAIAQRFFSDKNFKELDRTAFPADSIKAAWSGNIKCGEKTVEIIVSLPQDFPDVLPKIYLSKPEELPIIPHVDDHTFVCTFDVEHITFFSENVEGLLDASIEKAREVISEGIAGKNQNDFLTEMLAYWNIGTGFTVYSNLIPGDTFKQLAMACITTSDGKAVNILSENKNAVNQFVVNLNLSNKKMAYYPVLYLPNLSPFYPPFPQTNSEILAILDKCNPEASSVLLSFLNNNNYRGYVVFSTLIEGNVALGGWLHQSQNIKEITRGFPRGRLDEKVLRTRIAGGRIERFKICQLNSRRIHSRVGLDTHNLEDKTVCIIGCGSIGSKVAFNIYREGIGKLILIDDEILESENIGRHLCGISDLYKNKVDAVKRKIMDHYPDAEITCMPATFTEAYNEHNEIIDKADLIISCTADIALERTLNNIFYTNTEFPPVIYTWTEPFGIASHAILIGYHSGGCYECCLNPTDLHFYREVIKSDPETYMKNEAGCQTSFMPYSGLDVEQAATLTTRLSLKWLLGDVHCNIGETYIGDITKAKKLNIGLSDKYTKDMAFSNITFDVEKKAHCKVCSGDPADT